MLKQHIFHVEGAGFWDGDWQEPHAAALDALSKQFGNVDLYVGDDGKIYA